MRLKQKMRLKSDFRVLLFAINEWFVGNQFLGIGDRGHDGQDEKM
jgi:hypothetical protein